MREDEFSMPNFTANAPPSNALEGLTESERKAMRKRPLMQKYLNAVKEDRKRRKRMSRRQWWANNWLQVVCAVFAFISALPTIRDFIVWAIALIASTQG